MDCCLLTCTWLCVTLRFFLNSPCGGTSVMIPQCHINPPSLYHPISCSQFNNVYQLWDPVNKSFFFLVHVPYLPQIPDFFKTGVSKFWQNLSALEIQRLRWFKLSEVRASVREAFRVSDLNNVCVGSHHSVNEHSLICRSLAENISLAEVWNSFPALVLCPCLRSVCLFYHHCTVASVLIPMCPHHFANAPHF